METLWFIILWSLLGIYIILEAYEFGAGVIYIFFTDNDEEKKRTLKSIRSIWDANEVWLLAFLVLAYFVFPGFFRILLETFGNWLYLFIVIYILQVILQNMILVFFDKPFRRFLDWIYGIANLILIVLLGLFLGNIIRGNISGDMPLIGEKFSPFAYPTGKIDWFSVLFSFLFLLLILLQGLGWVIHKNRQAFGRKLKFVVKRLSWLSILLLITTVVSVYFLQKGVFRNFFVYPVLFVFPILMISSLFGLTMIRTYEKENKGFLLATNLLIYFWIGYMILLYPYLINRRGKAEGLSVFNTEFHSMETYYIQWWVIVIALIVLSYSIIVFKFYKGKSLEK